MAISKRIIQFLDSKGIDYRIDHHRPAHSAQDLAATEHVTGYCVAKTVVCIADGEPAILVLPAPMEVDFARVCEELEASEARLAYPDEIRGIFPDSVEGMAPPPLPLWEGVTVYADATITNTDEVVFAAGTLRDAIWMSCADWLSLACPVICDFVRAPVSTDDWSDAMTIEVVSQT